MGTLERIVSKFFCVVLISVVVRGIKQKDETSTGYILAGPDVMWLATFASVSAANIGTSP